MNFKLSYKEVTQDEPFFIAEIGHNHQGNIETAIKMIQYAALYGADAVKFQKRDNKALFTKAYYKRPYDNENSYGATYGEHREFLEFGRKEYKILMRTAKNYKIEFLSTAFDFNSVDFLEDLGIISYKIASADITNLPLLRYIADTRKPVFLSTGACTLAEVHMAVDVFAERNIPLVIMHCVAGYPTEYENINLSLITTLKKEFQDYIIGYSGHDNGILVPSLAYMLGARVFEKHFTLNHSWKGTDHKFSLEPEGLRRQIRDIHRVSVCMGSPKKVIQPFEMDARKKMGKSLYASKELKAGSIITKDDIVIKSPGGGLEPYYFDSLLGKSINKDIEEEELLRLEFLND